VPVIVIVVVVSCECGEPPQPPTNVAIVTSSITVNATCNPPRAFPDLLRRHRPASSSNSQLSTGTNIVFPALAKVFGPPCSNQFPTGIADFPPRALPSVSSVTASIVVTGPPFGVTECGSNSQSMASGKFEHENCTAWLKPFVGVTVTTVIPGCAAVTVTFDGATERVKFPAAVILIGTALDVDAAKFASPPYFAVIEWVPAAKVVVAKFAEPEPLSVPVPMLVAASKKVTVPVGTFVPLAGVTLAINDKLAPTVPVAGPVSVVVVEVSAPALTTCDIAVDVLVENLASPLYFAVIECVPCVSVVLETAATPPLIVTGAPICVALSKNVMVPVSVPAVADVEVAVKVTVCPAVDGFKEETTLVVVAAVPAAAFTTCDSVGEVLEAKGPPPKYCAVMACVPCVSVAIVSVALPAASEMGLLIPFAPSKNATLPVTGPAVEVTVAVNVTPAPTVDGFNDEVTTVEVAVATICTIPDDVAGANVASPLYMQKIEWLPAASDEVVNVALPEAGSVTGAPIVFPLSRKVTVPVGVPGVVEVTVAVKVTACPMTDGLRDEAMVARVAAPADAVAVPLTVIANGLFGALVVMNTLPLVWNPVKLSFVGANEMVIVHDAPGAMDDGQLLLAE
jgi:hypothetical protein